MPYPAACRFVQLALYDRVLESVLTAKGIGEESDGQDVELRLKWWGTKEQVYNAPFTGGKIQEQEQVLSTM